MTLVILLPGGCVSYPSVRHEIHRCNNLTQMYKGAH